MRLTVNSEITDEIFGPLDVTAEMSLQDLIALLEFECGFDTTKHNLLHKAKALNGSESKTLQELEFEDDELLVIKTRVNSRGNVQSSTTMEDTFVEQARQQILQNPALRAQILSSNPGFESIINDAAAFREQAGPHLLQSMQGENHQNPFGIPQTEYHELMRNPDDPANQKRISELISQQEIDEQMRNALEFTPEAFTTVHMLYVNLEINGYPVKAFVDSGAQSTIISTKLAEKAGLSRLIDKRFSGEAHGVGVQKIIGKIHIVQVKIETQHVPCSFTVLDTHVDMLLGLDMLKRHQACIDLKDNVLRIAGVQTRFLSEAEIPESLEAKITESTSGGLNVPAPSAQVEPPTKAPKPSKPNPTSAYPEAVIQQLMDLGFSRSEVLHSLEQANGNPDIAAALLFQ
ncbi:LAQU0S02e08724g1_1 [Lachancea quebecensis]|uniref:DNA damage-inducible protein 1 n=1 Tax=Lachancea quebecensis TaxID=1654605 RepID=A0A0P1KN63_9SACH|nr:LAQU0S02e08724g1_1 [Lachancea quebecensis]